MTAPSSNVTTVRQSVTETECEQMARWDSRAGAGLPDRPRTHNAAGDGGGTPDDPLVEEEQPALSLPNKQASTPGWDDRRRERWGWLRDSIADVAGAGGSPDTADIQALPEGHREQAKAIVAVAKRLHDEGEQAAALAAAREACLQLEEDIGSSWHPPAADPPDPSLLDRIQGKPL